MVCWAVTDRGKVRLQNQDTYFVSCDTVNKLAILLVCDGMGGAKAGNVASVLASDVFVDFLQKHYDVNASPKDRLNSVNKAIKSANDAVFAKSVYNDDYSGMGTTLVAAIVTDEDCAVFNIGDSRAYKITSEGIIQITRDHSVVQDMIDHGDITKEQSYNHPNKNLITRSLGTSSTVEADVFYPEILEGEYLLLCSDGLSNVVSEQELLFEVIHGGDIEDCCDRLLKTALNYGAPDNVTVALFKR